MNRAQPVDTGAYAETRTATGNGAGTGYGGGYGAGYGAGNPGGMPAEAPRRSLGEYRTPEVGADPVRADSRPSPNGLPPAGFAEPPVSQQSVHSPGPSSQQPGLGPMSGSLQRLHVRQRAKRPPAGQ